MSPNFSNAKVAELLQAVAAAYQIKGIGNIFQIRAYENAATAIEHSTEEIADLWQQKKLEEIPGVGKAIAAYLDELFRTGKANHFEDVQKGIPASVPALLSIPGVGPKTAYKLAAEGKVDSIEHLKTKITSGQLQKLGFSEKAVTNIARGIQQMASLSKRLLLPDALRIAEELITGLKADSSVLEAYPLGSVRRMVSTVGDIDLAVSTRNPEQATKTFVGLPQVKDVTDQGETKATVILKNGLQVDLMTAPPEHFGSLLQHFTGSKLHNIHLRELANELGWSVSEYGLKNLKSGKVVEVVRENQVYESLGLDAPPPEIREDAGEIELARSHRLPKLLEQKDIRGDLHTHTFYSDGNDSVSDMGDAAQNLGYQYIALTDHSYPNLDFQGRNKEIEEYNYSNKSFRVIKGLEVNITTESKLQVPDEILVLHEFNTASIHSGFHQPTEKLTERILMALQHPLIHMISHPTGRLIGERSGYDLDWEKVFNAAQSEGKVLEVNGFPNRSDLPDQLIREAVKRKIKLSVDTDSHHISHLNLMKFAVALARRGWATKDLVINSWDLDKLLVYISKDKIKQI
jgi:DNA polymerase (family 10)